MNFQLTKTHIISDTFGGIVEGITYITNNDGVAYGERLYRENGFYRVPYMTKKKEKAIQTGTLLSSNKHAKKREEQTERSRRVMLGKMNRDELRVIANTYGFTGKTKAILIEKIIKEEYPND